jgi:hypothetical protein
MITEKIVLIFTMTLVALVSFGQDKNFEFGIEAGGNMKRVDPAAVHYDSPTGSAYIGAFAEYHLNGHWAGKLGIRLNNTYLHRDKSVDNPDGYSEAESPEVTRIKQTLHIGIEPRFYFFSTESSRKTNFYAALPITYETAPSRKGYDPFVHPELSILPTLGFRYDINRHWAVEAGGALGLVNYLSRKPFYSQKPVSEIGYGLSAGIRYSF